MCPNGKYRSFHNGERFLDIVIEDTATVRQSTDLSLDWPVKCDYCEYQFTDQDERQIFTDHLYEGVNAEGIKLTTTLRDAPVGAMWNADWMPASWKGADGQSIVVVVPEQHDWCIDAVASNCDKRDDQEHRCWIRHGIPPHITVDKLAGTPDASARTTCNAGAGSIQTKTWHGMLQQGMLNSC